MKAPEGAFFLPRVTHRRLPSLGVTHVPTTLYRFRRAFPIDRAEGRLESPERVPCPIHPRRNTAARLRILRAARRIRARMCPIASCRFPCWRTCSRDPYKPAHGAVTPGCRDVEGRSLASPSLIVRATLSVRARGESRVSTPSRVPCAVHPRQHRHRREPVAHEQRSDRQGR